MKIKIDRVKELGMIEVGICGTESWLGSVYSNLEQGSKLEAKIKIKTTPIEDRYRIEGKGTLWTMVQCRRCMRKIDWNSQLEFNVWFIDGKEQLKKEKDLKESDLDEYWAEEKGILNLEEIINDMVQVNLPDVVEEGIEHECIDTSDKEQDEYSIKLYSEGTQVSAMQRAFEMMKKR